MAVCLQSGGLIDTGSLSVQDGLQLSQFGISSNSPNLPISSEREQAQRASTFWMFFLSFRLSSRITPPISLCLPFPILYLSLSLYRCFSVPLAFSLTLHALLLVSFSFLFHLYYFLPFFSPLELFSRPSSPSFPHSLSRFISCCFFCVCVFGFCSRKEVVDIVLFWLCIIRHWCHSTLMSIGISGHDHIKALLPWWLSAIVLTPEKKNEREMERWLDEEGKKCAVCVCVWLRSKNLCTEGCLVRIYDIQYLCVKCCMDSGRRSKGSKEQPVILIYRSVCALVCLYYLTSPCTHAAYCISVLVTEEGKKAVLS